MCIGPYSLHCLFFCKESLNIFKGGKKRFRRGNAPLCPSLKYAYGRSCRTSILVLIIWKLKIVTLLFITLHELFNKLYKEAMWVNHYQNSIFYIKFINLYIYQLLFFTSCALIITSLYFIKVDSQSNHMWESEVNDSDTWLLYTNICSCGLG